MHINEEGREGGQVDTLNLSLVWSFLGPEALTVRNQIVSEWSEDGAELFGRH